MAMTMALHRNFHWPMLGLALLLAACGGAIPTAEERRSEQEVAGYNQIMRIAAVTKSGGDLISAANFYRRAHRMKPAAVAPLLRLGKALAALQDHQGAAGAYRQWRKHRSAPGARQGVDQYRRERFGGRRIQAGAGPGRNQHRCL